MAAGVEVHAATGFERDTRDGHYTYCSTEAFSAFKPLRVGNMSGTHRWLQVRTHRQPTAALLHPPAAALPATCAPGELVDTSHQWYRHGRAMSPRRPCRCPRHRCVT